MTTTQSSAHTAASERQVRHGPVLAVTCLALATVVSAMASLNVALPDIARETQADQTQLSWIIDAYSLVFAALLLPAGALGDRFGRRRALVAGLALFGLASAAAAVSTTPEVLIALRAVLGVGAALVMPATLSTITSTFPRARRAGAVGVWSAVAGASAVLGLLASGTLLEFFSWPAVFWLNVGLAVAAVFGTLRLVPESAESEPAPLDVVGGVLVTLGLGIGVYAVIEAPEAGWSDPSTLGGICAGLAVLAVFVAWEWRQEYPLLNPRLFRNRRFSAGSISITLQFFAFFGFIFVVMQYLQLVRQDSALVAALSILPMPAALMPTSRISHRLTGRFGERGPWFTGLLLVGLALALLSQLEADSSYWFVVSGLVPLGAGLGLAMAPATTAITDALPKSLQNVGSAMNDLSREVGGALGIAVLGSLLNATYRDELKLPRVSGEVADAARSSLAAAHHIGGPVAAQAQRAFIDALQTALLCASGVALAAAVIVSVLLHRRNNAF
ncbi:MFS transporter [Streptomyces sp. NPDC004542]|uniref:MFS transporter n=1 Tax=Streptomyces sp. NPDC004542 TaxID=3154281 RepID=UPI0033AB9558